MQVRSSFICRFFGLCTSKIVGDVPCRFRREATKEVDKSLCLRSHKISMRDHGVESSRLHFIVGQHPHQPSFTQVVINMKMIERAGAGAAEKVGRSMIPRSPSSTKSTDVAAHGGRSAPRSGGRYRDSEGSPVPKTRKPILRRSIPNSMTRIAPPSPSPLCR